MAVPALAAKEAPRSDRAAAAARHHKADNEDAKQRKSDRHSNRPDSSKAANGAPQSKSSNASSRGSDASAAKSGNSTSHSQGAAEASAAKPANAEKSAKAAKHDKGAAKAAGENSPAGNKGSMKVRPVGTAAHPPRNYAHLPCIVQVDFYGSPHSGATLTAVSHAPTSPTGQTLLTESMTFSQPSPNPRGNELVGSTTLDFSSVVDGLTYHEQQGYHVKLTAVQDGPQGGDVKHKVFWVDCGAQGADEAVAGSGAADADTDVAMSEVPGSQAEVEGETVEGDATGQSGSTEHTQVAGVTVERSEAVAEVDGRVMGQSGVVASRTARALAATGVGVLTLALLGLVGLGGGTGLLRRFRR